MSQQQGFVEGEDGRTDGRTSQSARWSAVSSERPSPFAVGTLSPVAETLPWHDPPCTHAHTHTSLEDSHSNRTHQLLFE